MRILAIAAIAAGVVLFVLGMKDRSASVVKRLVLPIACVLLGIIIFLMPMLAGGFGSGEASGPDNVIGGSSGSSSYMVYFSPEEDDYYVSFWPSYDGVLFVYTKNTDGNSYYPEISVYDERLREVESDYNGITYFVPVEADSTYYISTNFSDSALAEENYNMYGSAYYELYVEFEGTAGYYHTADGAGNLEYNLSDSLDFSNTADLRYVKCAAGETVTTTFSSDKDLYVRLYDEQYNLIDEGYSSNVTMSHTADSEEKVYYLITTLKAPPGYIYYIEGQTTYYQVAIEKN
ncbi:MAG: hypothetical protein IJY65_02485 [Clostridia bacterium]|nr:hypothetical protein [Clostridia bacterium]